jgi:hypothetical protein
MHVRTTRLLRRRRLRGALAATVCTVLTAGLVQTVSMPSAQAFKPYTHIATGDTAYDDLVADGRVTIAGGEYAVRPEVVTALRNHRASYNSGVIGPDGFPDLVMGQSIIHPENTGLWLRHIMGRAWAAQTDPGYSAVEREQILAFAYGYLTHASGDLWMHTMINEFAEGVFPGVRDLVDDPSKAAIALRHLVAEGYVGDATPGFDGNSGREQLPDGDFSDDSTRAIPFAAPTRFIQRTLVSLPQRDAAGNVQAPTNGPAQDRGALLDFFHDLRATLAASVADDPQPIAAALGAYGDYKAKFDEVFAPAATPDASASGDCSFGAGNTGIDWVGDVAYDTVACPVALATIGLEFVGDSFEAAWNLATETLALALDAVVDAYLAEWVKDIDAGLEAWPELGLALTQGLFDPQSRRDLQNEKCQYDGPDNADHDSLRGQCEDAVGGVSVVMEEANDFINDHLLSMLGLPDAVGDLRALLQEASAAIDAVVGPALNPVGLALHEIQEKAEDLVKEELSRRYGIDVDQITDFLDSPSSKMDVGSFTLTLPLVGTVTAQLFDTTRTPEDPETDHEKLDRYLGIVDPDHHHGSGGGLSDDVVFDPERFAAFRNTTVLNRILLLDAAETDRLMLDLSGGKAYRLYRDDPDGLGNVMLTPLPGVTELNPKAAGWGQSDSHVRQWLKLIDGDHAWRTNGLPVFDDESAGEGNFPLWESCVLRDRAFRTLFRDWENDEDRDGVISAAENFPEHGDAASADPNDPAPPTSSVSIGSPQVAGSGFTYVSGATPITLGVTDAFWKAPDLPTAVSVLDADGAVVRTATQHDGSAVSLAGLADGRYTIRTTASDPCGTEAPHDVSVFVDNTAPVVTYTSPVPGGTYDTDDTATVAYSVADPGSGVASHSATFDGAASGNGAVLDMFFLDPGLHSVVVTATDRLGNTGTTTSQFRLRATSESLRNNIDRARSMGLITNNGAFNGLAASLDAAKASHLAGLHGDEANQLAAFINQLENKAGKGVDLPTALRFIAYARDLIASGG